MKVVRFPVPNDKRHLLPDLMEYVADQSSQAGNLSFMADYDALEVCILSVGIDDEGVSSLEAECAQSVQDFLDN